MLGASLTEDEGAYTVAFGESTVKIGKSTGLIESLISDGRELVCAPVTPTIWRAPTDNDRRIKNNWYKFNFDKLSPDCRETSAEILSDCVKIKASLVLASAPKIPVIRMSLVYTVSEGMGISVECDASVTENMPPLPRFGFKVRMPEDAEDVRYFGYGPYESYEDKRLASRVGIFKTTATKNFEHYVRPQENSAHAGCKWAEITTAYGQGLYFSAEKFSLSVSHFTPEYLTVTAHDYELVPEHETTVIIDYRNAGIGSNSCGPELLPQYRISEREFNFKFNIKPSFTANVSPFDEYVK
jgi:beta-galactosidase